MKELQDIENSLNELEKKGIELEKQLRRSEEGEGEKYPAAPSPPPSLSPPLPLHPPPSFFNTATW